VTGVGSSVMAVICQQSNRLEKDLVLVLGLTPSLETKKSGEKS